MLTITTDHSYRNIQTYAVKHDVLGFIFFSDLKASCNDFIKGYEIAKMFHGEDDE
jgi:hypothetical protein